MRFCMATGNVFGSPELQWKNGFEFTSKIDCWFDHKVPAIAFEILIHKVLLIVLVRTPPAQVRIKGGYN